MSSVKKEKRPWPLTAFIDRVRAKHPVLYGIYCGVFLLLMGIGIGLVSLFVSSAYLNELGWEMFFSYLNEPLILFLNLLPPVLLVAFFYFVTGRAWLAFTCSALIVFVLTLINYYKIRIRSEAFLASDIVLFGEAAGILSRYRLEITGRVLLVAAVLVFGTVFAILFMRGKLKKALVRVIGAVLILALLVTLFFTVYQDTGVYNLAVNKTASFNKWSDFQIFVSKGFIYPFMYSFRDFLPKPPANYSPEEAAGILSRYEDGVIPDGQKVNIIAVMLEAYSDFSEYPQVKVKDSVYEPLHALQEESLSGRIIANVFGGGTINTERTFLTGYPNSGDYRSLTNSYVWYLKSQGYYAEGLHPGDSWFYNRQNVQRNLGMDNYYFLEDFENSNRWDKFFFETLRGLYDGRDKSKPYFNFSVTYQNHGGYSSAVSPETEYLSREGLSDASYHILNNYLSGIADTSRRMLDFVNSFRADPEPVIIVFFGDHKPWAGDGNSVYTELGITLDLGSDDGFYNYYSTPYIIWANDAAKAATGGSFKGDGGEYSACYLMSRLFDELNWQGSGFMQFTRDIRGAADIINTGSYIYRVGGALTKAPEGDALDKIDRYYRVEYYMKHNFQYTDLK